MTLTTIVALHIQRTRPLSKDRQPHHRNQRHQLRRRDRARRKGRHLLPPAKTHRRAAKPKEVTVDAILEARIIQLLNASRKIVEEHHTVPCIDGVVVPSQPGKPNYDNPEEMVQHMAQALKHQKEQIARDKRTIDHLNIAMRRNFGETKDRTRTEAQQSFGIA